MSYIHGKTLIKIAVADDHIMLRESLCNVIDTWENCKVILQADNGKQFIELLDSNNLPDLALIDLEMPEMNGYDTILVAKKAYSQIKFMVVSMYQSDEAITRLINAGAGGFFAKGDHLNRFKKAIYEMMSSGCYFNDHSASRLLKQVMQKGNSTLNDNLSTEEMLFLSHIITEETYKEIADGMCISLRHVEYLRNKMFDRFDAQNRIGLAMQMIKKGIVV